MLDAHAADGPEERKGEGSSDAPDVTPAYIPPNKTVEPLTGRGPTPRVKRINPRTVAILVAITAAVAIAAFSTSLNRTPPTQKMAESEAQTTPAAPMAPDAINHLAGSYADAPQLGRPMPGDIGAMASGLTAPAYGATAPSPRTLPVSYASPMGAVPAVVSEEAKLTARAREGLSLIHI